MEDIMQTGMKREEKLDKQKELKREDEHLQLLKWISENETDNFPFMIIKGNEYDRFYNSDNEDDIMDMIIVECDEFYDKFKEITGTQLLDNNDFISMTYIDDSRNDINLIVRANGINQRLVIGV